MVGPPKPTAGNQGTQIIAEDLFYNVPQRKQALKQPNEEFQKIVDVVGKYAVHNANVGFCLKKMGEKDALRTQNKSTQIKNISTIYGNDIAKELLEIDFDDDLLQIQVKCLITNVNYSSKKGIFILFINHRLVESVGKCFSDKTEEFWRAHEFLKIKSYLSTRKLPQKHCSLLPIHYFNFFISFSSQTVNRSSIFHILT